MLKVQIVALTLGLLVHFSAQAQMEPESDFSGAVDEQLQEAGQEIFECMTCYFDSAQLLKDARAVFPVKGGATVISHFGDPRPGGRRHEGVDLAAHMGTPVLAAWDGIVTWNEYHHTAGYAVKVVHPNGYSTYYFHLRQRGPVSKGQHVKAGDQIGEVGETGNAAGTQPHLHFEVHTPNGAAVNPLPFIN